MQDKSFGNWLKTYVISFVFGVILIVACLMCGQIY